MSNGIIDVIIELDDFNQMGRRTNEIAQRASAQSVTSYTYFRIALPTSYCVLDPYVSTALTGAPLEGIKNLAVFETFLLNSLVGK